MTDDVTDEMIVAARAAIEKRQRSLIGKITKSSIRDALVAARWADDYILAQVMDASPRDGSGEPFPHQQGDVVRLYLGPWGRYTALEPGGQHWGNWRFAVLDWRGRRG